MPPTTIEPNGMIIEPTILFLILLASIRSSKSRPFGMPKIIVNIAIRDWIIADIKTILQKALPTLIRFTTGSSGKIPTIVCPTLLTIKKAEEEPNTSPNPTPV